MGCELGNMLVIDSKEDEKNKTNYAEVKHVFFFSSNQS